MKILVPTFPFTAAEFEGARETFDSLNGIADHIGTDAAAWSDELSDPGFCAALASHWALLSGREPDRESTLLLRDALSVTDEQLAARLKDGTALVFA